MAVGSTDSDAELIDRMNAIRNASEQHVEQFHHEVERLKDWREHVKARPVLALGVAAVAGFWLVSKVTNSRQGSGAGTNRTDRSRRPIKHDDDARAYEAAKKTTMTAGVMALFGSLATNAIRMAATHYVKSMIDKRSHHDRS